jgi:hypothetical protein
MPTSACALGATETQRRCSAWRERCFAQGIFRDHAGLDPARALGLRGCGFGFPPRPAASPSLCGMLRRPHPAIVAASSARERGCMLAPRRFRTDVSVWACGGSRSVVRRRARRANSKALALADCRTWTAIEPPEDPTWSASRFDWPPDKGIRADLFVPSPPARHLPERAEWWARSRAVCPLPEPKVRGLTAGGKWIRTLSVPLRSPASPRRRKRA